MKYKEWLKSQMQERDINIVQLRMMSTGNSLTCGHPTKYGIYLAETEKDDVLTTQKNAGIYSAIGGGFIPTADIEFQVRPTRIGYIIRRQHSDEFRDKKIVGFGLRLKGTDKIAYKEAQKTAINLSKMLGIELDDQTSKDLAEFSEYEEQLRLEERVYNYRARVKA